MADVKAAGIVWLRHLIAEASEAQQRRFFAGLTASAMYAFGGVAGATGKGNTFSAALRYANGPIGVAAGYLRINSSGSSAGFLNPETLLVWEGSTAHWEAWSMSPLQRVGTGHLAEGEAWRWGVLSADASHLLVSGAGDRLESYETATGKRLNHLNEHVDAAAQSADGRTVAVMKSMVGSIW